ncbi:MAG: Rrf2 family transcriptional regulator [Acidobacteriota bacterium]|nr:Rrf2 family transcriptional regulator [Acidobacteriota bacterium]
MRLSQHSDYALRMLIHAALRAPEITTVSEIADEFRLSHAHLQKVAQTLAAHGYIETIRGRSGGIRLARAPDSIHIGRVIAVTEPDFQLAPCMGDRDDCPIYDPCTLRLALARATDAFLAELDTWTLTDLIRKRKPLLVALGQTK